MTTLNKSVEPINLKALQTFAHALMLNGVSYRMGAKVKMEAPIGTIRQIDCSGFVRRAIYESTKSGLLIPDGSWHQHEWVADRLPRVPYSAVDRPESDATLFLAFIAPTKNHAGHVWFVCRGDTFESYGGRGVGSRVWNRRPLPQEVDGCYEWPHIWV